MFGRIASLIFGPISICGPICIGLIFGPIFMGPVAGSIYPVWACPFLSPSVCDAGAMTSFARDASPKTGAS